MAHPLHPVHLQPVHCRDETRISAPSGRASPPVSPPESPPNPPVPLPPVVLMPRRVPGGVLATLDALPAEALPRLEYGGPVPGLRRAMRAALAERLPRPRWLANWLLDDVLDHAALMVELTGASALRVSLRVSADASPDHPLGAAEGGRRLVTAYRGAGFDWLPPRPGAASPGRILPPAGALRRLPRGDVAVLRGGNADEPAVAHRAAPGPGTALLLAIDEAGLAGRATGALQ